MPRVTSAAKEIRIVWPEDPGAPVILYALVEEPTSGRREWREFRIWEQGDPVIAPIEHVRRQLINDGVLQWPSVEWANSSMLADPTVGVQLASADQPARHNSEAPWGVIGAALSDARTGLGLPVGNMSQAPQAIAFSQHILNALERFVELVRDRLHPSLDDRIEDLETIVAARLVSDGRKSTADVGGAAERVRRRARLLPKGI